MTRDETAPDLLTAAGFLTERQDFLYVYATKSVSGAGWDVVVRIDGTYSDRTNAKDAALDIADWLTSLTDVGKTERYWWGGPPELPSMAPEDPPLPLTHAAETHTQPTAETHTQSCAVPPVVGPLGDVLHVGASRPESSRAGRG